MNFVGMKQGVDGRTRGLLIGVAATLMVAAGSAQACITVCVGFGGTCCPPNKYNRPGDCTNRQPRFDCDTDGDGVDDAWCSPITLPNPGGGNFPTTDSCGNMLSLPCIPDPRGPGKGRDYFRPTWKKPGEMGLGTELGQCLYRCGRNSWKVGMCDTNGDGTPDKFMNSKWTTKNGGTRWPFTGESKTFCVDIGAATARGERGGGPVMTIVSTEFRNGVNFDDGYRIRDTVMLDYHQNDLSHISLDGMLLGEHLLSDNREPIGDDLVAQDYVVTTEKATRMALVSEGLVDRGDSGARAARFTGTVTNITDEDHLYQIALMGVNLELDADRVEIFVPAGETGSVEIVAEEINAGRRCALATYAYAADAYDIDDPVIEMSVIEGVFETGDLNGDFVVDTADLAFLLADWGQTGSNVLADLNQDGIVNSSDLAFFLGMLR